MRAGDYQQLLDRLNNISLGCIAVTITRHSSGSTKSYLCLQLSAYHSRALIMVLCHTKGPVNNCQSLFNKFFGINQKLLARAIKESRDKTNFVFLNYLMICVIWAQNF